MSDQSNEKKLKEEPSQQSDLMAAVHAIKSEVEVLKEEVRRKDADKIGRRMQRRRPSRCSSCVEEKEDYCNHCFKCGSNSHFVKRRRLPLRDGKKSQIQRSLTIVPLLQSRRTRAIEEGYAL